MDSGKLDELISTIYEAAVDKARWADAIRTLAEGASCSCATLEVYARGTTRLVAACNPFTDPAYKKSYLDYWCHNIPFRSATDSRGVGQVFDYRPVWDVEALCASPFYHEWLVHVEVGGDSRYANLAVNSRATVLLGAFKPHNARMAPKDERLFAAAVPHFVRAFEIQRRLQVAESAGSTEEVEGGTPADFLIVDDRARVLAAHERAQRRLLAAGLLRPAGPQGTLDCDPRLARLACGAASGRLGPEARAGHATLRGADGTLLRLTVVPLAPADDLHNPWRIVDSPAALIHVAAPEEAQRERARRMVEEFGLSPAETAVAIEAAKGDGRAMVAARLGIRETTVRSHLSAIFEKLGIHRQAELARFVSAD